MSTVITGKAGRWLSGAVIATSLLATLAGGDLRPAQARSLGASSISGNVIFWNAYNTVSPENSTLIDKVIPAFQKLYPNVTVYSQNIPYPSLLQKLIASIAGGSGPDVVRSDIIWMPQLAKIGAIDNTDAIIAKRKNEFYAGPLSTAYYQGHYYGLPLDTNTRVVIYNKTLFSRAGISAPPTTTAQFMTDAAKISGLGKNIFGYAESGLDAWNILPWIWSFGGAVTNAKFTTASNYLDSAKSVAALQFLVDLKDKGYLSPSILGGGLGTDDALGKNLAGMILDGPWAIPTLQKTYPKLQFGLAPMPAGPGGQSASVVGGEDIVEMKSSQNSAAALAFMQFMTSPQAQLLMGETGQMPVLKSLAHSPQLPAYYAVFNKQLQTAYARTVSPNWTKIDSVLTDAFNKAIRHQATPAAALDSATPQINSLLQ